MKQLLFILIILCISFAGCSQNNSPKVHIGGACEGCEAIHESTVSFDKLKSIDTLTGFQEKGTKIAISGIVYKADGTTPAKDVVLYIYHTDQKGIYPRKGDEKGWGKRHGYIRGWIKTDEKGFYKFFTLKPASYPGRKDPAHIHVTIKEPDKNEYWIDDFQFDDDPILTAELRKRQQNRGGNGIVKLKEAGHLMKAERNIYLGKNIPDYPKE